MHRRLNYEVRSIIVRTFVALVLSVVSASASSSTMSGFGCGGSSLEFDVDYKQLGNSIANDFYSEDFKSIIDAASLWKAKNCHLRNGQLAIYYWLSGFTTYFRAMKNWEDSLAKIQRFKAVYPDSVLPRLAEARYWSDYANNARGFGSASTVTSEGWKLFAVRLEKSEKILLEIRTAGANWPQWYWQMIRVQSLLERDEDEIRKVYLEGARRFPDALAIYTEMSYYFEPRWGGSWEAVDGVVSFAAKNARREDADATYARMYMQTADLMPSGANLFSETMASWPRMRRGFVSLLKLYPESTLIRNEFLAYSCLAGDKATYASYRDKFEKLDERAWQSDRTRDQCDTAMGVSPQSRSMR